MSDWKQSAARRRDERHTKAPDAPARAKTGPKSTKRWCRGKCGVEHKPRCRPYDEVKGVTTWPSGRKHHHRGWFLLVCDGCGKELDWYMPIRWHRPDGSRIEPDPRPAWVTGQVSPSGGVGDSE